MQLPQINPYGDNLQRLVDYIVENIPAKEQAAYAARLFPFMRKHNGEYKRGKDVGEAATFFHDLWIISGQKLHLPKDIEIPNLAKDWNPQPLSSTYKTNIFRCCGTYLVDWFRQLPDDPELYKVLQPVFFNVALFVRKNHKSMRNIDQLRKHIEAIAQKSIPFPWEKIAASCFPSKQNTRRKKFTRK